MGFLDFLFLSLIGPWRWFDESMLECCEPLEIVKDKGITFGKVVCLAHSSGAKVQAFRTTQSTIHDFRKYVFKCSTSDNCHMISTYHRGVFKQVQLFWLCTNYEVWDCWNSLVSGCRLEQDIFRLLVAIMLKEIWLWFLMSLVSSILLIGFLLIFFGMPWTVLISQQGDIEGTLSFFRFFLGFLLYD